ncbi:MAG TPA: helix-turn-helix domain-containing protein [Nitrospinae bacterium]|nr:helix-turn-helix domain-containing protein [Nitrospinota bacterium]
MFWIIFERAGLLLGTVLMGKQVASYFGDDGDIKPNSIYSPEEIASILTIEKADVMCMIHRNQMKAWKVNGFYRILGSNVLEFLSKKDGEEMMFQELSQDSSSKRPEGVVLTDKENRKFLFGGHGADHEMWN